MDLYFACHIVNDNDIAFACYFFVLLSYIDTLLMVVELNLIWTELNVMDFVNLLHFIHVIFGEFVDILDVE